MSTDPSAVLSRMNPDQIAAVDRLIAAVRIGLNLRAAADFAPIDKELVRLATVHGVRAEVARTARMVGSTDDAALLLSKVGQMDGMRSLTARDEIRRLVDALERVGVAALALKGVALGVQTGRDPADRPGTDIDLLVLPDDWQQAHECLLGAGYQLHVWTPPPRSDWCTRYVRWSYYEAGYRKDQAAVDLHWRLGPGHCASITAERLLARRVEVDADGVTVPTLHPDDALAQTLVHGAKDGWSRLRSVVDAHLLVSRAAARWERAAELLPRSRVVAVGRAGVEHLVDPGQSIAERRSARSREFAEWASGVVCGELQAIDTDARISHGYLAYVRRRAALTPSVMSASAVLARMVLSPQMIATSRLKRRWWPLILVTRPFRAARRLVLTFRPSRSPKARQP